MSEKARAKALAKIEEKRKMGFSGGLKKSQTKLEAKPKNLDSKKRKALVRKKPLSATADLGLRAEKISSEKPRPPMKPRAPMKQSEKAKERAALRRESRIAAIVSGLVGLPKRRSALTRKALSRFFGPSLPRGVMSDGLRVLPAPRKVRKVMSRGSVGLARVNKIRAESSEHRKGRTKFHDAVFAFYGSMCHFCGRPATDAMHVIDRARLSARQRYAFPEFNGRPGCRGCHERQGVGELKFSDSIIARAGEALATLSKSGVSPAKTKAG